MKNSPFYISGLVLSVTLNLFFSGCKKVENVLNTNNGPVNLGLFKLMQIRQRDLTGHIISTFQTHQELQLCL